jgi:hypothetical protein
LNRTGKGEGVVGRARNFLEHLEAEINGKECPLRKSRYAEGKIILVSKPMRTLGRPSSLAEMLDGVSRADKVEPQLPPTIRALIRCDSPPGLPSRGAHRAAATRKGVRENQSVSAPAIVWLVVWPILQTAGSTRIPCFRENCREGIPLGPHPDLGMGLSPNQTGLLS